MSRPTRFLIDRTAQTFHIGRMHGDTGKLVAAALFIVALIALVNIFWWIFYEHAEDVLDRQLGRRLETIAATGASLLDAGIVESLAEGNFEAYGLVSELLEDIRSASSLSELFILNQNFDYLVTTSIVEDSTYLLFDLNGPYISSLFFELADGPVSTPSYQTGDIFLKSAYAPLYDSTGYVLAVLGVEADVDYADALTNLRGNLYYASAGSVAAGVCLGIVFLLVQRRVNRIQRRLFINETQSFMGRMVAVVAHEIKNPLSIMRASAERLRKKQQSAESEFIIEEVDRLNDIVSGYLNFAVGGRESFVGRETPETIAAIELVSALQQHLCQHYSQDTIQWLDFGLAPEVAFVGHRRALRQVLLNLLINGADACRDAGRPIVLGLQVRRSADSVELAAIDHGPGIHPKDLQRIFEPFYTTRQTGSGLGLFLSRKIVEDMGGKLIITSQPGKKTEVVVRLPQPSGD